MLLEHLEYCFRQGNKITGVPVVTAIFKVQFSLFEIRLFYESGNFLNRFAGFYVTSVSVGAFGRYRDKNERRAKFYKALCFF